MSIVATVSTKGRYFTTLPITLSAIANQTRTPDRLIIFDDNDNPRDLRRESPYSDGIFPLLHSKNIECNVVYGKRMGQVVNHQAALEICSGKIPLPGGVTINGDVIIRFDDDLTPEYNVIDTLYNTLMSRPNVGAVGGMVWIPGNVCPNHQASNKIEDVFTGLNWQWFSQPKDKIISVDHLSNPIMYRVEAGQHGYCRELSPVGHREETLFVYEMKRAGWEILVNPSVVSWHMKQSTGGIRSYKDTSLWAKDEEVFKKKLSSWGIRPREAKYIIMDNGIGDHWVFKGLWPEIREKYKDKRIMLGLCWPDVFWDIDLSDVTMVTMADARQAGVNLPSLSVYKWMMDHHWQGSLEGAFRELYLK